MRHALVTGGQGFIGSVLARHLLERGFRVSVVDRRGPEERPPAGLELQGIADSVELVVADLSKPGAFEEALEQAGAGGGEERVDTVFHLAAQTLVGQAVSDPAGTFEVNVGATWQLCEVCCQAGVDAVVVASSDKAYGPSEHLPYREDQPLAPTSPYEASKAACDLIASSFASAYGLPVAVTRMANVYGGGDTHGSRLVPEAIAAALEGRDPVIRSDGSPERDYLHVSDAVEAYLALAEALHQGRGHGRAYNAGTGRPVSVRELLKTLSEVVGRELRPRYEPRPESFHEIDRQYVDAAALAELTGWVARVELADGLREALDWYAAHPEVLALPDLAADADRSFIRHHGGAPRR